MCVWVRPGAYLRVEHMIGASLGHAPNSIRQGAYPVMDHLKDISLGLALA